MPKQTDIYARSPAEAEAYATALRRKRLDDLGLPVGWDEYFEAQVQDEAVDLTGWRGAQLNSEGRFREALQACEETLVFDPACDIAYNNRGVALLALGQFDDALASCEEALWLNPSNASAHNNRGSALGGLGRFAEAAVAHDHAVQLDPEHVAAASNLGDMFVALGYFEEALVACERASELDATLASPQGIRGMALFALGRFSLSAEAFAQADRLASQQEPLYLLFRAVALLAIGEPKLRQEGVRLLAHSRFQGFLGQRLLLLRIYQFLHALSRTGQLRALTDVKGLMELGLRFPPDWRLALAPNIAQVTSAGHEDAPWLLTLSEVLMGRESWDALMGWPTWSVLTAPAR
jgi:tetratricopeptide (TPR) repeat protein